MHKKYLIITGGSRGIGKATIERFLAVNWQIINISRTPCELPNVENVLLDLAKPESIAHAASLLTTKLQQANHTCLVHNAAYYQADSSTNLDLNHLYHTLKVNLISVVALNNIFIPLMLPQSSIIYIGSTLAEKAVPDNASYIISKHALIGLMRATCQDLAPQQIRTCCICPGLTDTQLLNESIPETTRSYLLNNKIIGKRLIQPTEIAELIYVCATQSVINGVVLHANLGQLAD